MPFIKARLFMNFIYIHYRRLQLQKYFFNRSIAKINLHISLKETQSEISIKQENKNNHITVYLTIFRRFCSPARDADPDARALQPLVPPRPLLHKHAPDRGAVSSGLRRHLPRG